MDHTEDILGWWTDTDGMFDDLGRVMPFIVIDAAPSATDRFPKPVLVGAKTLQRSLIGSADPRRFQDILATQHSTVLDQILRDQNRVLETWTPLRSCFSRSYSLDGSSVALTYDRLLLPVRMTDGRRMIFTHTSQSTRH